MYKIYFYEQVTDILVSGIILKKKVKGFNHNVL